MATSADQGEAAERAAPDPLMEAAKLVGLSLCHVNAMKQPLITRWPDFPTSAAARTAVLTTRYFFKFGQSYPLEVEDDIQGLCLF